MTDVTRHTPSNELNTSAPLPVRRPVSRRVSLVVSWAVSLQSAMSNVLRGVTIVVTRVCIGVIRFYQRWISAARPPTCRFYPSCSTYTLEAVECHGPWRGLLLGVKRLAKCHPFHKGGFDPVPTSTVAKNDSD